MSASKEKINRSSEQAEGLSKKAAAEAEQAEKNRKFMRRTIIAIVVIVVVLAAALVINSDLLYTRTTAVQIGDTRFSPAEVSYFYKSSLMSVYDSVVNQYGQEMADMVINPSAPLKDQPYSGDQSWADVILDYAIADMQRTAIYGEAAVREGHVLSEEGRNTVDGSIATMEGYAIASGYSNVDKFLAAYFGKGMNTKIFADLVERTTLANEYAADFLESLTYTDEELNAYYEENAEDLDFYDYIAYSVSTSFAPFTDLPEAARAAAAHEQAEKFAAAADPDEFRDLVHEFTGTDTFISISHNTKPAMSEYYIDWLTDPARVPGDSTVIDTDNSSIALYFVGKDDNNYNTVSMRHILLCPETDENGDFTEEALETAKTHMDNLYERWQKDPTEENFVALAAEFSEDDGSVNTGGLYTGIAKSAMVENINSFLFEEGRQPGDTTVVLGTNGNYTGYHLVYFVGEGENNRTLLARSLKQQDDYAAKYEELSANYETIKTSKMKFASIY